MNHPSHHSPMAPMAPIAAGHVSGFTGVGIRYGLACMTEIGTLASLGTACTPHAQSMYLSTYSTWALSLRISVFGPNQD